MKIPQQLAKVRKPKTSHSVQYIILGLGNPGIRYHQTRHNVGFWFLEKLSEAFLLRLKKEFFRPQRFAVHNNFVLIEPLTYMNRSGSVLPSLEKRFPEAQIVVVTDNMDLPPGILRLKQKIGTGGGHNGVRSVNENSVGSPWVLYVGVGRPQNTENVIDYVLSEPGEDEEKKILAAISQGVEGLRQIMNGQLQAGLNVINTPRN